MVVHELHVARAEFDGEVELGIVGERIQHVQRLVLGGGEAAGLRKVFLRGADVLARKDRGQLAGMPVEHRQLEPRQHARRDFAAPVGGEGVEQLLPQVRPEVQKFVMQGDRADQAALTAGLGGLQAQQPDDVARVGVVLELAVGLVVARRRFADVEAEVAHVPEQVPFGVLRTKAPEVRPDAEVGHRAFRSRVLRDREPAQHDEPAAMDHLVEQGGDLLRQGRQPEGRRGEIPHLAALGEMRADRRVELREVLRGELVEPLATLCEFRAFPGGRPGDGAGWQGGRLDLQDC